MEHRVKIYLYMAYLILFGGAIAMFSPQSCENLKERNKELDKLSGIIKVVLSDGGV